MGKKRLRIFAGPNGSGKSTITHIIKEKFDMGVYVNADELKVKITQTRSLDFSDYKLMVSKKALFDSLDDPSFISAENG